ncbi:hypothetical protein ACFU5Z_24030 [Streptomyces sp. NPDC057521]|uniref:hypothetical protein n=1 Tax=Streptomyces sp. NPDC057521 TaxID=3346156 RepID=UPI00369EA52E
MRGASLYGTERRNAPSAHGEGEPGRTEGGPWLLAGHDGRLTVYLHTGDALLRWTQEAVGASRWSGPDAHPVKDLTHLTVAQGQNRYVHFVGRRVRPKADGRSAVDIVCATQYQTGRPVTEWRSLGNPFKDLDRSEQVGVPSAAVANGGALYVCVPTAWGGAALRREDRNGQWEAWKELDIAGVTDRPSLAATAGGLVELLAPTRAAALHLRQSGQGEGLVRGYDAGVVPLPGSATALETAPGRMTHYLTDVRGSGVVAFRPGNWPMPLGGTPGDGRIAAVRGTVDGFDCTVLAVRGPDGSVHLGACSTEEERGGMWWTDTNATAAGDPSLALDGYGRVVVAVSGADGRPVLARQTDGPGLTLGDWSRI